MTLKVPRRVRLAALASGAIERVRTEPVIASNLAASAVALVVGFGIDLSVDLKAGIIGLVGAGATLFARTQSVPVEKLVTGEVTQSGPGEPVTLTQPGKAPIVFGRKKESGT
jgi:hypothetical protein